MQALRKVPNRPPVTVGGLVMFRVIVCHSEHFITYSLLILSAASGVSQSAAATVLKRNNPPPVGAGSRGRGREPGPSHTRDDALGSWLLFVRMPDDWQSSRSRHHYHHGH